MKRRWPCRLLQPRKVIPMHFGTFPALTGTPEQTARGHPRVGYRGVGAGSGQARPVVAAAGALTARGISPGRRWFPPATWPGFLVFLFAAWAFAGDEEMVERRIALERGVLPPRQRLLPRLEVRHGNLEIAFGGQHQHAAGKLFDHRTWIVRSQIQPVRDGRPSSGGPSASP